MKWSFNLSLLLAIVGTACQQQVAIRDIQTPPMIKQADEQYADVFKSLDGQWEGIFYIYEDTIRGPKDEQRLQNVSKASLEGLKLSSSLEVQQIYQSPSPFFQTVNITDYYPKNDKTVKSQGVNKVQAGKLWCVVEKPDETIIHEGQFEAPSTLIWQRNEQSPQKIEYFRETVEANSYKIIGWGYYEGDDPEQMPKYWFYGDYRKKRAN